MSAHREGSGNTHREGEWDEEDVSKVRRGFSEEDNHCDWAGMSVAIEPTSKEDGTEASLGKKPL